MSDIEVRFDTITYTIDTEYTFERKEDGTSLHTWTYKGPTDIHYSGKLTDVGKQWLASVNKPEYILTIYPGKRKRKRTWPFARIYRQWAAGIRAKKRISRQHRAAFRRRKRGLV